MATPQEIRKKRLQHDLQEMETIRCDAIQWRAKGDPLSKVFVTFNIRSIISVDSSGTPKYRNKHEVVIDIPEGYPF